jgi:alanine racemase
MDLLTVDATAVEGLVVGEEAWLLGGPREGDPPVSTEEMAEALGTIPYEVTCRVGGRVPRLFLRDGAVVEVRGPRNGLAG